SGQDVLALGDQFFENFLSRAQSDVPDFDILIGHEPTQSNQVPCKISNANRLTHIENENLGTLAYGGGMQDKLDGLLDGHEVASRLWMGHSDGPASCNLELENRDDTAIASQHISEPHRNKLGGSPGFVPRHGRGNKFRDPLGCSHHTGGIDRLVGGDQQKIRNAIPDSCLHHVPGAKHVICDRLEHMTLHQWDMLVGCSVEDPVHRVEKHDFVYPAPLANVADFGDEVEPG